MGANVIRRSNVDWLSRLVVESAVGLQSFLRKRGCDDPADLAQEVYLRLLRSSDAKEIRNPEAYLFAVAQNLLRERAVARRREGTPVPVDTLEMIPQGAAQSSVQSEHERAELFARINRALDQIPPKSRAVVLLHYRDGLSYVEVGERLGISVHMVKKHVVKVLSHLRETVAER
jgi:RNA polymerase sigma-70 factor (ECF subfamily)